MELNFKIASSSLLQQAGLKAFGSETKIKKIVTLNNTADDSLLFSKYADYELLKKLANLSGCLMVLPKEASRISIFNKLSGNNSIVLSENPRLDFARLMQVLEEKIENDLENLEYEYKNGVFIGKRTFIGKNTFLEPGAFIDHDVKIGDNCIIRSGAIIRSRVQIGNNVTIRENTVVGGPGFGIEKDEDGNNLRIPHLGGVIINSNVEIGALNTVVAGTIEPTVIGEYVKTDDHVHIAHNCYIGKNTTITACVEISGSVFIGENCMIGPNSSIMNGIKIGNNTLVGLGSVVTKTVAKNKIVAGNPADLIENIKTQRKVMKKIIEGYKKSSNN